MKYKFIIFCFLFGFSFSQNLYPIILIHGFLGWDRDKMAGYYYWGGTKDFQKHLQKMGYAVYTVSIGPISSNRDRAIETFYQIKGGQAARMLEILLKEKDITDTSLLLSSSYKVWIKSITTISTPHNRSAPASIMLDTFPFAPSLALWFGSIDNKILQNFYSLDLEQWGLRCKKGEAFIDFWVRLSQSDLINTNSLYTWDLSPMGTTEFNNLYTEDNNVYYFSFITTATKSKKDSYYHSPSKNISIHIWPTALLMESYKHAPNNTWFENDGIDNSVSMSHPHNSNVIELTNQAVKKIWQSSKILNLDHREIIGHNVPQS